MPVFWPIPALTPSRTIAENPSTRAAANENPYRHEHPRPNCPTDPPPTHRSASCPEGNQSPGQRALYGPAGDLRVLGGVYQASRGKWAWNVHVRGETKIAELKRLLTLFRDERAIFPEWEKLVAKHQTKGKNVHDPRWAAAMFRHHLQHLLTLNAADSSRYPGITVSTPTQVLQASPWSPLVAAYLIATGLPVWALLISARAMATASRLSAGVLILGFCFFSTQSRK